MKTVAIIIPNFNKAKYLDDCIQSALNQDYPHKEIIFVDDCSTDNSLEIAKKYQAEHDIFHIVALPKNGGVSNARNVGVQNSSADYFVFLDSDDVYINKSKLKNEMALVNHRTIAFSQYVNITEDGNLLPYKPVTKNVFASKRAIVDIVLITKPAHQQLRGYVIPRQLFLEVGGYDTSLNIYEDFDLQCRLALNASFAYTKEIGEGYRCGTGGLSTDKHHKGQSNIENIQKKYYKQLSFFNKIYYLCIMFKIKIKRRMKQLIYILRYRTKELFKKTKNN